MVDISRAAKAIGAETRYGILKAIFRGSVNSCCDRFEIWEKGVCVGDVVTAFGLSQSTVSHHLSILEQAGLICREQRGLWTCYFPNKDAVRTLLSTIEHDLLGEDNGSKE